MMNYSSQELQPRVSVITVVLNAEKVIERCIKSVLSQTYQNIEYIIVDGDSTDRTLQIVDQYRDRIDILVSERDNGVYDAMNKGCQLSHGDYIIMLNSDDFFTPDAIELSVDAIMRNGADYSGAPAFIVDENGTIKYTYWPNCFDKSAYVAQNPCAHETMLVSRIAYEDIGGYDTRYKIAADLKFELELIRRDYIVAKLEKPILYFTDGGLSSNEEATRLEVVDVLSQYLSIPRYYIEAIVLMLNKGLISQETTMFFSDKSMLEKLPTEVLSYLATGLYYKYLAELNTSSPVKSFNRLLGQIKRTVKKIML